LANSKSFQRQNNPLLVVSDGVVDACPSDLVRRLEHQHLRWTVDGVHELPVELFESLPIFGRSDLPEGDFEGIDLLFCVVFLHFFFLDLVKLVVLEIFGEF